MAKTANELKLLNNKLKATCEQKQIKTNIKRCSKNRAESILKTENKINYNNQNSSKNKTI
jgi:hypothetical protein